MLRRSIISDTYTTSTTYVRCTSDVYN
jgi:hypothetical protein